MSFFDWVIPLAATGASLYFGNQAAENAAEVTAQSSDAAIRAQREMFDLSREDLLPFRETGAQSLFGYADLLGVPRPDGAGGFTAGKSFETTPGYQFRVDEGIKALDRSAAARGGLLSGAQTKAVTEFGQNAASSEFNNYMNRIASLSGLGQTAATTGSGAALSTGANMGNTLLSAGNAQANAGIMGANNVNNALSNLTYAYGRYGR